MNRLRLDIQYFAETSNDIGIRITLDPSTFNSDLAKLRRQIGSFTKALSEIKLEDGWDLSVSKLTKAIDVGEKALDGYKTGLKGLEDELARVNAKHEAGEISTHEWEKQVTSITLSQQSYKKNITQLNNELKNYKDLVDSAGGGTTTFAGKLGKVDTEILKVEKSFQNSVKHLTNWEETTEGLNNKIGSLNSVLTKQQKRLEILQDEYNRVNKIQGYSKERKDELINSINKEYNAINKTKKEMDKYTKSLDDTGRKAKETKNRIEELVKEFNKEAEVHGRSTTKAKNLKTQINALQKEYNKLESELKEVDEAQEKANSGWTIGKQILADLARTAIQSVVNGLKNMATSAWESSISFESAFTGVTKTVEATDEEIKQIEEDIINLSKRVPSTANDIARVAEVAGQLGIDTANIVSFSEVMIGLGEALEGVNAEDAAMSLAKFANITGMNQKDFDKLGSTITSLGNNAAATEGDIIDMATRIASTGEIVGLSEAQIFGLATSLSSVGIEAEAGGTAISKLLKNMNVTYSTFDGSQKMIGRTGKTLRELELMASNNSTEFKKLTDSLGLTQAELKASMKTVKTYSNFAETAGYSTKEFSEIYKKDAVEALALFIEGLQDTERNGKNAVEILQEMGLTEVRLSNAILALSTAESGLVDNVQLANKAWEENTALATEVNRRYETTESKLAMLKNGFTALSITMFKEFKEPAVEAFSSVQKEIEGVTKDLTGNKGFKKALNDMGTSFGKMAVSLIKSLRTLLPSIIKLVTEVAKLGEKVLPSIIKVLTPLIKGATKLATAILENYDAIMPLIVALVSFKTTTALATKGIALYKGAIGLFSKAAKIATGAQIALNTAMKANIIGLVVAGIAGLVTLLVKYSKKTVEADEATKELVESTSALHEETNEATEAYNEMYNARSEAMSTIQNEIDHTNELWQELQKITDENGKIKDGYEGRAKFIVNELNNALGTEIKITDGVINKYGELEKSIDDVIAKKRAMAFIEANEESYQQAITKEQEATARIAEAEQSAKNLQDQKNSNSARIAQIQAKLKRIEEANPTGMDRETYLQTRDLRKEKEQLQANNKSIQEEFQELSNTIADNKDLLEKSLFDQQQYETNYQYALEGHYDKINFENWEHVKEMEGSFEEQKKVLQKDLSARESSIKMNQKLYEESTGDKKEWYKNNLMSEVENLENLKTNWTKLKDTLGEKEAAELQIMIDGLNEKIATTKWGNDTIRQIYLDSYSNQITDALGKQVEFRDVGNGLVQAVIDGVETGKPFASTEMDNVVNEMNKQLSSEDNLTDTKNKTKSIINKINTTLKEDETVGTESEKVGSTINEGIKTGAKPSSAISNILSGLVTGLSNSPLVASLLNSAKTLGSSIIASINKGTDSKSPSRKAIQAMGNVMSGLKKGLTDNEQSLYKDVESFGDTLTGRLQTSLGQVKSNISGSVNLGTSQNGDGSSNGSVNNSKVVNWTQNYTMPKSMSRTDMYLENKRLKSQILQEINVSS